VDRLGEPEKREWEERREEGWNVAKVGASKRG